MDEKSYITSTKKVSRSGNGYVVRISKDIVSLLDVNQDTYLELKIRKIDMKQGKK